jgi:hypothetical protein
MIAASNALWNHLAVEHSTAACTAVKVSESAFRACMDTQQIQMCMLLPASVASCPHMMHAIAMQANSLINEVDDKALKLKYQASYARVADSKRRFLDAAMKYYELSQVGTDVSYAF